MSDEQFSAENADGAVMSLQGGQVGHDNIMYNLWLENRKIDASRVEQLSSHAAADYLIGLKADDAAESMRGTHGYYRSFENGIIHWTESSGAHASHGPIAEFYIAQGGSGTQLGFP